MSSSGLSAVVVLAAGIGSRMASVTPKVLHQIGGRSLLGHVLAAAQPLRADQHLVVVGAGRELVTEHLAGIAPEAETVVQEDQLGSGHATALALEHVRAPGPVLILNGDVPLLTTDTLAELVATHSSAQAALTVLTARVDDAHGLGRILRDSTGAPVGIVEDRDAGPDQLGIDEVNAGAYIADGAALASALERLRTSNAQGEQYLTDAVALFVSDGNAVAAYMAADASDVLGCNDRFELAARGRTLNDRVLRRHMSAGVTIIDPATTWIDVAVEVGRDVRLLPGTQLHGSTSIAEGAILGPDTTLTDCVVGENAVVVRTHGVEAVIGPGASVGPYTYLRPGTRLGPTAKAGAFVEIKNADVGKGSKIPHLSYIGDATIGEHSNIGAATVFVNYDGIAKHRTTIGSHARTGADNMFVAPVSVGDGAYTAAGSVITEDVPPGAMGVSRARQRNIADWVRLQRPGTPAAEAARAAAAQEPDSGSRMSEQGGQEQA
ncbi:MAG: bifunctional UDP-N-acetylglucosamine diphosphorylase/glucosamine-1-phosphate N-acetyltransferase GlmU [Geodermatophilaceae bacterium]|nr:bifunctional UDP-N-acetylglucosamine diphosphorylase/glucosamine-1-phosphate N-acetyltransferase GlmU [Geodermatophilaceae bacterium]